MRQLVDREDADFGDRLLHVHRLIAADLLGVLARADVAFDLNSAYQAGSISTKADLR